jgi:hypothetical protein
MEEHLPNHYPFEEAKFISPFISPKLADETKQSSSPSLEPKTCPSCHLNIDLGDGRDSTLIKHDVSFEKENSYAMDMLLSAPCPYEDSNYLLILISKLFRRMVVNVFVYHKYYRSCSCNMALTLQLETKCPMVDGEVGNYTTIDRCKRKFPRSSLRP